VGKLRWLILLPGLAILLLGGALIIQAQTPVCNKNPAVGPVVNTTAMPFIKNFDPCTNRMTMTDDALKHTGGPYKSKTEVEGWATANVKPTKVRSYFVTYGQALKMLNDPNESSQIYPDREVWVVAVQALNQGPMPSLPYGIKPWPRRWFVVVYDATTGRVLEIMLNGSKDGDWPVSLPSD
jgi:hypothetical protein